MPTCPHCGAARGRPAPGLAAGEERVEQDLDVAGDLEARARDVPDAVEAEVLEVPGDWPQRLQQRSRLRILVDEHEVAELLATHLVEPEA